MQFKKFKKKNYQNNERRKTDNSKPSVGWFKLNTDASVLPSSGRAGGGGLLRDSNGAWVQGFSRLIGSSNVLLAELWALRDGLTMASNLNIEKLIIHMDASEVINLLSKPFSTNQLTQPIVTDCRSILQVFQEYRVQHCYRETNRAADLLANMGRCQDVQFISFVNPPFAVLEALEYDSIDVNRPSRTSLAFG